MERPGYGYLRNTYGVAGTATAIGSSVITTTHGEGSIPAINAAIGSNIITNDISTPITQYSNAPKYGDTQYISAADILNK